MYDKNLPLRTLLPTGGGRCNLAHAEYDFRELVKNDEEKIKDLQARIKELKQQESSEADKEKSMQSFVEAVKEIGEIKELDAVILNTLVDKIVIGERQLVNDSYEQDISIYYKFDNAI